MMVCARASAPPGAAKGALLRTVLPEPLRPTISVSGLGNVMTPPCSGLKLRMPLMSSLRRAARKPRQLSATQRSQRAPRRARGRAAVKRAGSPQRRAHERGEAAAQLVHKAAKPRTCQPWPSCGGWQPPRGPRLSGGARRQYQPGDTLQPEALRSVKRLKRALGRARAGVAGPPASVTRGIRSTPTRAPHALKRSRLSPRRARLQSWCKSRGVISSPAMVRACDAVRLALADLRVAPTPQFGMFGGGGGVFDSSFRAYPVSFIDKVRTPRWRGLDVRRAVLTQRDTSRVIA